MKLVILALVACLGVALAADDEAPILIVQKVVHTPLAQFPKLLSQNQNFTVEINIHNVGQGNAYGVQLVEEWLPEDFRLLDGTLSKEWDRIAPGEKVSHNISLLPIKVKDNKEGFLARRAVVEYKLTEDAESTQRGYSSPSGRFIVISEADHYKLTAKHLLEWGIFGAGFAGLIAGPFYLLQEHRKANPGGVPREVRQ